MNDVFKKKNEYFSFFKNFIHFFSFFFIMTELYALMTVLNNYKLLD